MKEIRENRTIPQPEELQFDEKRYLDQAARLLEQHHDEIAETSPDREKALSQALKKFPDEVLEQYWGHGVTRGDYVTQIAAMLSMLENKVYFGMAGRIKNSGYVGAYTHCSFFVISRKGGGSLIKGMSEGKPERVHVTTSSGEKKVGVRMDPGAFVVNGHMDALREPLKKLFPNERILSANELPAYIQEQEAPHNGN